MIPVRRYVRRRNPSNVPQDIPDPDEGIDRLRRPPSSPGSFGAVIDDVVTGRRKGYTWTGNWKFDIDDPISMERVYKKLGQRQMYIIASTNRTLEDYQAMLVMRNLNRPGAEIRAMLGDYGVGFWRDDEGTIYADEVRAWMDLSRHAAIDIGRRQHQKYILRVDGRRREFEFIPTGSLVGQV